MYKVKVETLEQFNIVVNRNDVSEVILARDSFYESSLFDLLKKIKNKGKKASILLERISRYEEKGLSGKNENNNLRLATDKLFGLKELDGIIIQNLDSFAYMLRKINKVANKNLYVELNYTMNCYNLETKRIYEKLYNEKRDNHKDNPLRFTAPVELNVYELSDVGYDTFILYGYVDTMVTANCLNKNIDKKDICKNRFCLDEMTGHLNDKKQGFLIRNDNYIKDRKNMELHYKTYCKFCYNKIFNTEPTYLLDKEDEIKKIHIDDFRIDFTFENADKVRDIFNKKIPSSFTRGHIKNSII